MLPIGHLAFAYFVAMRLIRHRPATLSIAALFAGALGPTVLGQLLVRYHFFGISHFWAHSPLLVAGLLALTLLAFRPFHALGGLATLFTIGWASHLIADFATDFALLYFSSGVDDIGVPWVYPWTPVVMRSPRLDPGFDVLPWQLLTECFLLLFALWVWARQRARWKASFAGSNKTGA